MNTINTMNEVHLPELSGSEKQIKWANDIRENLLLAADANVRNAERNVELMISPSTTNIPSVAGAEWARETAVKELMSVTKASDIIDARDRLTQDTLERMGKYYDSQLAKATTEDPPAEDPPAEEATEETTEETATPSTEEAAAEATATKRVFDGVEYTACTFVPACGGGRVNGLYIHDQGDPNCDGDCVVGNEVALPETAEEAADILRDEYTESDGAVLETVQLAKSTTEEPALTLEDVAAAMIDNSDHSDISDGWENVTCTYYLDVGDNRISIDAKVDPSIVPDAEEMHDLMNEDRAEYDRRVYRFLDDFDFEFETLENDYFRDAAEDLLQKALAMMADND